MSDNDNQVNNNNNNNNNNSANDINNNINNNHFSSCVQLLQNRGVHLDTTSEREAVRRLKESACYVALDYEQELNTTATSSALEKSYALPDGSVVPLDAERYMCAEALFRPDMVGLSCMGIDQLVFDAISATPLDIRKVGAGLLSLVVFLFLFSFSFSCFAL